MMDDAKVKYFMINMLTKGVKISYQPEILMPGLADYINNCGRDWYALGDEDGVIIHNAYEEPLLICIYKNDVLSFNSPFSEQFDNIEYATDIKLMLLNIIGYLSSIDKKIASSHDIPTVGEEITTVIQDDDWSI